MSEIMAHEQEYPIIPCVQCGYCCTIRPCDFGEWNEEKAQCKYLTEDNKCGIYDEIIKHPESKWNPGFGAGCSSPMFNTRRDSKIKELEDDRSRR